MLESLIRSGLGATGMARDGTGRRPLRSPTVNRPLLQQNQPPGVPPLELTGERTLPDVPDENYWFRRHLAVYEWIAARCHGLRVTDLACGEGYGSEVLSRTAAEVVGIDANPDANEHARLRYRRPNLRFERGLVEDFAGPCDAVVFLQTIEHLVDADATVRRIASAAPLAYISTPNRLTLARARVHARRIPGTARPGLRRSRRPGPLPRAQAACARARAAARLGP